MERWKKGRWEKVEQGGNPTKIGYTKENGEGNARESHSQDFGWRSSEEERRKTKELVLYVDSVSGRIKTTDTACWI